jgi:2-hydroxy-6-oxonona-2,4-dienedioate hydrolase
MQPDRNPELRSIRLHAGGYELHALVSREGPAHRPPVVLVHGLGMSTRYLRPLAESLAGAVSVSAPDLPGFGHSESPPHVLTIPELADTVIAWLDALRLETAALVGNSLGCQIIAEAAARHPDRVSHAVLIGPSMDPRARTPAAQIARLIRVAFREPLAMSRIAVMDYLHCGTRRLWRTFQHGLDHPMADRLRQVQCPTLVLRGEHDLLSTAPWCEEATRRLPHGDLMTIPDAAHAVHFSHPDIVSAAVTTFLDQHPEPATPNQPSRPQRERAAETVSRAKL